MAMRTPPSWLQAGSHTAENDRLNTQGLVNTAGVSAGTNDLLVTQSGTPAMTVSVAAGWGWVLGTTTSTQGMYSTYNDAATTLTVTTANPTNPRIDIVCMSVRDAAYTGASNDVILQVVAGTAAASPTVPATPASSIVLAQIAVAAGATSIVNANITDVRTRAKTALPISTTAAAQLTGIPESGVTNLVDDLASKTTTAMAVNAQTGTTYSFVIGDAGKTVSASNASASTYNIPLEASVPWVANTELRVWNIGAGTVTVTCTSGTLAGTVTIPQYGFVTFKKLGTNTWYGKAEDTAVSSGGLVLVNKTDFSAASSVLINNCFTATYDWYKVEIFATGSTSIDINFRLRVGGVDATASNYSRQLVYGNGTSVTALSEVSQAYYANAVRANANGGSGFLEIFRPAIAAYTTFTTVGGRDDITQTTQGIHTVATAYDGFSLTPNTGTISGTVRTFGYKNS